MLEDCDETATSTDFRVAVETLECRKVMQYVGFSPEHTLWPPKCEDRAWRGSQYLGRGLTDEQRDALQRRLLDRQGGRCFICDGNIDLVLHRGHLDIDHIDPLAQEGADAENNFALTHSSCNRSKGASNLEVARRLAEFERLQEEAKKKEGGRRGANLGDVLAKHGGRNSPAAAPAY